MKIYLIKIYSFGLNEEDFNKTKNALSSLGQIVDSGLGDDKKYRIECDMVISAKDIHSASNKVEEKLNSLHIAWDYINTFEQ